MCEMWCIITLNVKNAVSHSETILFIVDINQKQCIQVVSLILPHSSSFQKKKFFFKNEAKFRCYYCAPSWLETSWFFGFRSLWKVTIHGAERKRRCSGQWEAPRRDVQQVSQPAG